MLPEDLKQHIVAQLEAHKVIDLVVLDVHAMTDITHFMILGTGSSNRHVKSLASYTVERCKELGVPPLGVEGQDTAEWILVDVGDVVVHLMQAKTRAYYELEKLWDPNLLTERS